MKLSDLTKSERCLIVEMAYGRSDFKNKLSEKLRGALLEFYKAECATQNNQTRWVAHWRREARDLISGLQAVLLEAIKGRWNKLKALDEVIIQIKSKDLSFRKIAEYRVGKDFKLRKKPKPLQDASTKAFWGLVSSAICEIKEISTQR